MTGFPEYDRYDAVGLAQLVRDRHVSASELVEEAIARIERVNPRVNAVVHTMYAQARARAKEELPDGPFAGVPFLLKDLVQSYDGAPTTGSCRFTRDWVPDHHSELVRRYLAAGLIVVGKTNTPELGILPVTEPELRGPCRNPWDTGRTTGGSSGGAGAAVATGIVPAAHGGDGGGSIRIPASCCGVFGLKPTRARNPMGPDSSEGWAGFVSEHVLTRSVRDSAAILDATEGPEPESIYWAPPKAGPFLDEVSADPGHLRIGFHCEPAMPSNVHPDCVAAVRDVAALCEDLGHRVEEVRPGHDPTPLAHAFLTVIAAQTAANIDQLEEQMGRTATPRDFESQTWVLRLMGQQATAADYAKAIATLQAEARRICRELGAYDLVLTPTLGQPPLPIGALRAQGAEAMLQEVVARASLGVALKLPGVIDQAVQRAYDFVPWTPVGNFTGRPSMSVPLVWNDEGLPIGTMFTGRLGDEATLFRLAGQLEAARPWRDRRPPVHAAG